jgi:hypothetical protein
MDRLDSKAVISGQIFTFCTEVKIESSYDHVTDTAEIIIPKKIRYIKTDGSEANAITRGTNPLFKMGDPVTLYVGYNTDIKQCFSGYISTIRQKFPLRLESQDAMYLLKKKSYTFEIKGKKLSDLLKMIIPKTIPYEVTADQNLGQFRVVNSSAVAIFDELRKNHGIYSWFRDGKLYSGFATVQKLQKVHRFEFETPQLIDGDKLDYLDAEQRPIKIICKSIDKEDNQLEFSAGAADGEVRSFYFSNLNNKDLEDTANRLLKEYKYSGYDGYFTIFATPLVNHGDVVELINKRIPEQSGGYLVTKVVTRYGWDIGGKQDVYLKQKIYDLIPDANGNFIQKDITQ